MSTIAPQESKEFAKIVAEKGGKYIDAPVSGSVGAAVAKFPLAKLADETYAQAKKNGKGKLDMSAVYLEIKERSK